MNLQHPRALLLLILVYNVSNIHCADDSRALTFVDIAARKVEQITLLPQVLAKLVIAYDGGRKFGLKQCLPPEDFESQQAVLACGLLACVMYDGTLIKKNLATNEVVEKRQLFTPEEKGKYCVKHPLTALPDGHLAIPVNKMNRELNGMIKVLHPTNGQSINIPLSAVTEPEKYRFTLLPGNELVVYSPNRSWQDVFDIQTGEHKRRMDYGYHGCGDIVLLPGGTVAEAHGYRIVLSDLQAPLEECCWDRRLLTHSALKMLHFQKQKYSIDRLAALSKDKLALAAHDNCSKDAYLVFVNPPVGGLPHKIFRFPNAQRFDLVALSENTVATRSHVSREVVIVEPGKNDTFTNYTISAASPAEAIQGLPNDDLFVEHADRTSALWGTSPDMSLYEQAGRKRKKKKTWVLV